MKIYIGADHAGWVLKDLVASSLKESGNEVVDVGTNGPESVDYPTYAFRVARAVGGDRPSGVSWCAAAGSECAWRPTGFPAYGQCTDSSLSGRV